MKATRQWSDRRSRLYRAVCAVLLLGTSALALAKSYDHPLIEQTFRLLPNGDAEVTDIRTYRFSGSFSWADLRLKTTGQYGSYGIEYLGVKDADTGAELPSEQFSAGGEQVLKWSYKAEDEVKRFELRYRITGAVQRYPDAAHFYWKAIEDKHAPIETVRIRIVPPKPSPTLFKVFVHSLAAPGRLTFADDFSQADVEQSDIPEASFVELRVLLDPAIFVNAEVSSGQTYESLLEDERRNFEQVSKDYAAMRLKERLDKGLWVLAGLLFVAQMGALAWAYREHGREPRIAYDAVYEREPPREIPPAVVPAILPQVGYDKSAMGNAFAATLLEAARLGYLEIREVEDSGFLGLGLFKGTDLVYSLTDKGRALLAGRPVDLKRKERPLQPFEVDVLRVAFVEAGSGDAVTSDMIEKWGKEMVGQKSRFLIFIESWGPELRMWFENNFFQLDDQVSARWKTLLSVTSVLVAVPLLFTTPPFGWFAGAGAVLLCVIIAQASIGRRTPEAALEYRRWQAFKRMMTDFTALKSAGPEYLPLWELYLVYATALGVADKLLDNLKMVAKEYHQDLPAAVWFHSRSGVPGSMNLASLNKLSSSMSNFNSMAKALSSSTSSGGGFSGGGGGGGGGGSSSAG
ncbi:MAG: DUF2207 domain-containing protein [Fimbriimonadia bacterium]